MLVCIVQIYKITKIYAVKTCSAGTRCYLVMNLNVAYEYILNLYCIKYCKKRNHCQAIISAYDMVKGLFISAHDMVNAG